MYKISQIFDENQGRNNWSKLTTLLPIFQQMHTSPPICFFLWGKNTALDVIVVSTIVDKSNLQNLNLSFKIVASLKWRQWAKVQFMVWDSETPKTPRLPRLLSYYFSIFLYFRFTTFSNFSNSSDSKVKVKVKGPNICYIFEKHGIQGCWI